ncbi:MAG: ABC transporter ATP-binding protein [Conexivisphaerales archaeon]
MSYLEVVELKKYFPVQKSFIEQIFSRNKQYVKAVDGISFSVKQGSIHGLVGESGSGKSTTGRLTTALLQPTSGKVYFEGRDVWEMNEDEFRETREKMAIIFQDPTSSLNPKMKVGEQVADPLRYRRDGPSSQQRRERAREILEKVGLSPAESFYDRYPHQLSGGQRQRVVIARALVTNPSYVVADEPVAMVDVSVRAQIMQLLVDLRKELGLTMLMITHDLAVAKYMCDAVSVMYLGKIVEEGSVQQVFSLPLHPYTQALLNAVPVPDPENRRIKRIPAGEIPNPISPPSGCRFHPRCPIAESICAAKEPELREVKGHKVACHFA